jgi:dolichol-phosphate mannosyltransferase
MKTHHEMLVFVPTYNERENVELLYKRILNLNLDIDILFIDDHSPDGTGRILDEMAQKDKNLKVIHRRGKLGIGTAHQEGIRYAYEQGYKTLITMDCDFTHPPELIMDLIKNSHEADIVVGSRYVLDNSLEGWNLYRKSLALLGHFLTKVLLKMPYDATGAFRLYRLERVPVEGFDLVTSKGYSFFFESLFIFNLNKFKIRESAIKTPIRAYGHSKMRILDACISLKLLLVIYAQTILDKKRFKIKQTVVI